MEKIDTANDVAASLIPSKEFLDAMNFAMNGPSRHSLPRSSLMFWTRDDFGILKEYARLFPDDVSHFYSLPWLEDPELVQECLQEIYQIAAESSLKQQAETLIPKKSIWKFNNMPPESDLSDSSSDSEWMIPVPAMKEYVPISHPYYGYEESYDTPCATWDWDSELSATTTTDRHFHFQLINESECGTGSDFLDFNRSSQATDVEIENESTFLHSTFSEDVASMTAAEAPVHPLYNDYWEYGNYYQYYNFLANNTPMSSWFTGDAFPATEQEQFETPPPSPPSSASSSALPSVSSSSSASASPISTTDSNTSDSNSLFDKFVVAYAATFLSDDEERKGKKKLRNVYAINHSLSKQSDLAENVSVSNDTTSSSSSDESFGEGPIIEIRGRRNSTFKKLSKKGVRREFLCVFCKGNNEPDDVYKSHPIRVNGIVMCPFLRNHICALCKATGDNAHTIKYCPQNKRGFFAMKAIERAANAEIAAATRKVRMEDSPPFKRFPSTIVQTPIAGTSSNSHHHNKRPSFDENNNTNIFTGKQFVSKKNINCEKHHHFGKSINSNRPYAKLNNIML